jgi:hypothetical protein
LITYFVDNLALPPILDVCASELGRSIDMVRL